MPTACARTSLDLGGGFPAAHEGGAPPLHCYATAIHSFLGHAFGADRPDTLIEPGRGVAGDAGTVVTRVIAVLRRGDVRWVYLDCGVFTGLVETLDEAIRYRLHTPGLAGPTGPCVLAGPTCDSTDVLYERTPVAAAARAGRGRRGAPAVGRRLHVLLLHRRLQRLRPAADRPGADMRPPVNRLLGSHALASVAMSLPWPWLLVLVWDETHSPALLGLTAAARMLPYVVCSWWAARVGRPSSARPGGPGDGRRPRSCCWRRAGRGGPRPDRGRGRRWPPLAVAVATPGLPRPGGRDARRRRRDSDRATDLLVTIEVASFVVGPAFGGVMLGVPALIAPLAARRDRRCSPAAGRGPARAARGRRTSDQAERHLGHRPAVLSRPTVARPRCRCSTWCSPPPA